MIMDVVSTVAMFILGLAVLLLARYWTVNSLGGIFRYFKFSQTVTSFVCSIAGFTIIELVLISFGQAYNEKALALGVVLGSVIAGVALVAGIGALIKPYSMEDDIFRREAPLFFITLALLYVLGKDFELSRADGVILIAAFCNNNHALVSL